MAGIVKAVDDLIAAIDDNTKVILDTAGSPARKT
jgi:hypothetical protein